MDWISSRGTESTEESDARSATGRYQRQHQGRKNFLESNFIKNYNPVEEFLFTCYDNWDGKDHIRALARTVPTNNPHWEDWFYT